MSYKKRCLSKLRQKNRADWYEMHWRVEMLGGLTVQGTPSEITVKSFRTRRAALLLAYLALKPGVACSRERLGEMLWPEEDPQVQRTRLRYELTTLRSAFSSDLFAVSGGNTSIALQAGVFSDVAEFDRLTTQMIRTATAEHRVPLSRQAMRLYQGDLLPGYELPDGCPPEYDWVNLERQRLREAAASAATTLVTDLRLLGLHDEAALLYANVGISFPEAYAGVTRAANDPVVRAANVGEVQALYRLNQVAPFVPMPPVPLLQGRFFGRAEEVQRIRDWAEQSGKDNCAGQKRVLTIVGPGGIGKTRLLLEAILGRSSAVLVPLAGVSTAGQIDEAIHSALTLTRRSDMSLRSQIVQALHVRPDCLLLLDNCEHLASACATCAHELLSACPKLRIVTTSQRPLDLSEEQLLLLTTLPLHEAEELFLERARTVRSDFAATPASLAAAKEIVALLDALPLALELAAARAAVLGSHQMRDQLRHRLKFLTSTQQARLPRHRSMRAVLQWSVDLLSENARRALAFLSVFRTGATIEAVQAIVADDVALLDALEELRLCSLLLVRFPDTEHKEETTRYDLLFLVRDFAAELLVESERDGAWERHAHFWAEQGQGIPKAFRFGQWKTIQQMLVRDRENIRAAVEGATRLKIGTCLYQLTDRLCMVFLELGFWEDADLLLTWTENKDAFGAEQLARLLGLQGALNRRRGAEQKARHAWERRLELVRQIGNVNTETTTLFDLAGQSIDLGELARAETLIGEGMCSAEKTGRPFRIITGRVLQTRLWLACGEVDAAYACAISTWEALSTTGANPTEILYVVIHLLPTFRAHETWERAAELVRVGLPLAIETGQEFLLARLLDEAAPVWEAQEKLKAACLGFFAAQQIHFELGSRLAEAGRHTWRQFCLRNQDVSKFITTSEEPLVWQHATQELSNLS